MRVTFGFRPSEVTVNHTEGLAQKTFPRQVFPSRRGIAFRVPATFAGPISLFTRVGGDVPGDASYAICIRRR